MHQLVVNSVPKNVVYVATENNSIYALDSDSTNPTGSILVSKAFQPEQTPAIWGTGYTEIALPSADLPKGCSNITPESRNYWNLAGRSTSSVTPLCNLCCDQA